MKIRVVGKCYFVIVLLLAVLIVPAVKAAAAAPKEKQPKIIEYQKYLRKEFKKVPRTSTRFIIIHTSEAGLVSTLRTLSRGKSVGKSRTIGGHANYAVARNGNIYKILHHRYRADHAGLSMWDGLEDISSHSLGIELVGYHYDTITPQQYKSLSWLLKIVQRTYRVPDKNVLTHSQVSYGKPNRWFKLPHRGRKRCALNFDRKKAGLKDAWDYDPDVRAGRLSKDRHIYAMFYKKGKTPDKTNKKATEQPVETAASVPVKNEIAEKLSNIISKDNTAWNIAGEDYEDSTTLYILPGNRTVRGDRLGKRIGWDRIPAGTQVMLNQPLDREEKTGPVFLITKDYTAWSFAGVEYRKPSTIYFLPTGRIKPGNRISDWDSIPEGTSMIIGYNGPISISARKGKTPWGIAGKAYNHKDTIYFIPGKGLVTGDQVENFSHLPRRTKLFLKI